MPFEVKLNKNKAVNEKVDEKMLEETLRNIARGAPYQIAAGASGFGYRHFVNLLKQGELDLHAKLDTKYSRCYKKLKALESDEIEECKEKILFGDKGASGAQWWLSRKYYKYFSESAAVIELSKQLEEIQEQLRKNNENQNAPQKVEE